MEAAAMKSSAMKCKSILATALKNALERYTRLAEETRQMYERTRVEAESEKFENFQDAFVLGCFEVLQAQTSEFKNLVWLSDNFWMIIERDGTTLWDIVQRARSIEATLKHAVERARGECEQNRLAMSDLNKRTAEQNEAAPSEDVVFVSLVQSDHEQPGTVVPRIKARKLKGPSGNNVRILRSRTVVY